MAWKGRDPARFYSIDGIEYPSVTTVLSVLDKPALVHWAANQERIAIREAVLEILTTPRPGLDLASPEMVWAAIQKATTGVKAHQRESEKAAAIGTAAHAWIEWKIKGQLGKDIGPEPEIPDAARLATMAYEDWAVSVNFKPVHCEGVVYSAVLGYAGTYDWIGYVKDVLTLGDFKTSKAVYPEAFLQNVAYRRAAYESMDLSIPQGIILRLPKLLSDPSFEAVWVPDTTTVEDFVAVYRAWRWKRQAEGLTVGTWREAHAAS